MTEEESVNNQLADMLEKLRDSWPDLDSGIDGIDSFIEDRDDDDKRAEAIPEILPLKEELLNVIERIDEILSFIKKNKLT